MKLSLSHRTWLYKVPIFIILFSMLSSVFTVGASAASQESYFLETLINTNSITYQAAGTIDPEVRKIKQKYASKYIDMQSVLLTASADDKTITEKVTYASSIKNPNVFFELNRLSTTTKSVNNGDYVEQVEMDMIEDFLMKEGYMDTYGNLITSDDNLNLGKDSNKTNKHNNPNPLSFPSSYSSAVSDAEINYATTIHSSLVSNLNSILRIVNDGIEYSSVTEMVNKSIMIRPDDDKNIVIIQSNGSYSGYILVYADLVSASSTSIIATERINYYLSKAGTYDVYNTTKSSNFLAANNLPRMSKDNGLLCYVFPIVGGSESQIGNLYSWTVDVTKGYAFEYAFPKGYVDIGDYYDAEFDVGNTTDDTPWISIHMLSSYANRMFKNFNVSTGNTTVPTGSGMAVIDWLLNWINKSIYQGLKLLLGLSSVESLVYNTGVRGTANYNFGLMSEDWWNVVLQYQLLFQAIAWVILIIGFLKTLIDLNLSTINPQKRLTVYDTVQKFLLAGIGLVILIPCIQFMLECNNTIVELFASQINTAELNQPTSNNLLIQFIVNMVWLAILFYINFVYVMRAITIALLIASGPFFIATMSFPRGGKSALMSSWSKELIANIFVQSVHAFVLSFLMQLLDTGTFIEQFAIAISIIPLTEMFRSLIFAGAGESVSKMANTASNALMNVKNSAVDAAGRTGAVLSGFRDQNAEDGSKERSGGSGGGGAPAPAGGSGGGGMKPRTGSFGGSNPNYMRTAYNESMKAGISQAKEGKIVSGVTKFAVSAAAQSVNMFSRQSRDWTNLALNQDTRMRYCMEDDLVFRKEKQLPEDTQPQPPKNPVDENNKSASADETNAGQGHPPSQIPN